MYLSCLVLSIIISQVPIVIDTRQLLHSDNEWQEQSLIACSAIWQLNCPRVHVITTKYTYIHHQWIQVERRHGTDQCGVVKNYVDTWHLRSAESKTPLCWYISHHITIAYWIKELCCQHKYKESNMVFYIYFQNNECSNSLHAVIVWFHMIVYNYTVQPCIGCACWYVHLATEQYKSSHKGLTWTE